MFWSRPPAPPSETAENRPWSAPDSLSDSTASLPLMAISSARSFSSVQMSQLLQLINDSGVDLNGFSRSLKSETMAKWKACLIWILDVEYDRRDLVGKAADLLLQVPVEPCKRVTVLLAKRATLHPSLRVALKRIILAGQEAHLKIDQVRNLVEDLIPKWREAEVEQLLLTVFFVHPRGKEAFRSQPVTAACLQWILGRSLDNPLILLACLDSGNQGLQGEIFKMLPMLRLPVSHVTMAICLLLSQYNVQLGPFLEELLRRNLLYEHDLYVHEMCVASLCNLIKLHGWRDDFSWLLSIEGDLAKEAYRALIKPKAFRLQQTVGSRQFYFNLLSKDC